ncbi:MULTISPECIES: hypothetical protein [Streptomyces]|uniref:hypothetical protein n=1 Tax=Streptomyces TaxID=1883 RepID=UPI000A3CA7AC|nr:MULTISPECIES: hypothetical protein [Streptomyces]
MRADHDADVAMGARGLGRAAVAPDVQADLFLRQHLSRVDRQVAGEPVLGGGEAELSGVTPGAAGHVVQDQVPVTGMPAHGSGRRPCSRTWARARISVVRKGLVK